MSKKKATYWLAALALLTVLAIVTAAIGWGPTQTGAAKNINTVGASATSFTKKGLKSGTTYYVQIREIKKVGSTTYIGNISNPVKVKVK